VESALKFGFLELVRPLREDFSLSVALGADASGGIVTKHNDLIVFPGRCSFFWVQFVQIKDMCVHIRVLLGFFL
jgi:hypothetical protein